MLGSALFMLFSVGMAAAQDQVIQVGAAMTASNPFVFSPPNITAKAGSVITFNFSGIPGFHSVSQAAFNNPCQLMDGGFSSGFVEIGLTGIPAAIPQWNLTITNGTTPIWFFCQQLAPQPHCPTGMVGSINAPTSGSNTFEAFQAAARSSKGTPGQGEGGLVGVGASASAPPSPLNTAGVSGLNNPTMASAPSSTGSVAASSTPSSTGTASGAVSVTASSFVALIASFISLTFA